MRSRPAPLRNQQRNPCLNASLDNVPYMSASAAVRYHTDGAVGVITLDRPDNRNSMTPELLAAFSDASALARADASIRSLVVTGTGSSFSAGADFKSMNTPHRASAVRSGPAEPDL